MAKFIRCPKCESQVDVTNVGGGSIITCECGVKLRVPTGQTAIRQAPAAPPPAPEKQGSKRQTAIMRKMAGVKAPGEGGRPSRMPVPQGGGGSKQGLIIGGVAVGVILLAGVAFLMSGKNEKPKAPPEAPKKASARTKDKAAPSTSSAFTPQPPPEEKFEKGARVIANVLSGSPFDLGLNAGLKAEFEALAGADKVADIVREDYKWLIYIFDGLLSDSEAVARGSFQALFDISRKRAVNQDCNNQRWPSAEQRAQEYNSWVFRWWLNRANQAIVAKWAEAAGAPPPSAGPAAPGAAPAVIEGGWDVMVKDLQNGGMGDVSTPAGAAFSRIQRLGKSAYPQLIKYISHEDLSYARIATAALIELTKRKTALPNESTRDAIKKDWEDWYKSAP